MISPLKNYIIRNLFLFLITFAFFLIRNELIFGQDKNTNIEMGLQNKVSNALLSAYENLLKKQGKNGGLEGSHSIGNTALMLLAFMSNGYFPERGIYGEQIDSAVCYLLDHNNLNQGYMASSAQGMYEHALSTLALAEVWGMSSRSNRIENALKKAVSVISIAQHPSGGWRYNPDGSDHDSSVTALVLIALLASNEAGIRVDENIIKKGIEYLQKCQDTESGGYGYQDYSTPGLGRTGACTLVMIMKNENEEIIERGIKYINGANLKQLEQIDYFYYSQYYIALVMNKVNENELKKWFTNIQSSILARQKQDGSFGSIWETCYAIQILSIPKGLLPIFQRSDHN